MQTETRLTFEEVDAHIEQYFSVERLKLTSPITKADIYNTYFAVKPVLGMVSKSFFIPVKWRDAIKLLMQVLDTLNPCSVANKNSLRNKPPIHF